jgi:hypothetical protein
LQAAAAAVAESQLQPIKSAVAAAAELITSDGLL